MNALLGEDVMCTEHTAIAVWLDGDLISLKLGVSTTLSLSTYTVGGCGILLPVS